MGTYIHFVGSYNRAAVILYKKDSQGDVYIYSGKGDVGIGNPSSAIPSKGPFLGIRGITLPFPFGGLIIA